jgi:hypothetical protein
MAKSVARAIIIVHAQLPSPLSLELRAFSKTTNESINGFCPLAKGAVRPDWPNLRRPDHARALATAWKLCWSNIEFQAVFMYVNTHNMAGSYAT